MTQAFPLSYKDLFTLTELVYGIRDWSLGLGDNLKDELNRVIDEVNNALNVQDVDIAEAKESWETLFTAFMGDVTVGLEGLNDQAAANLVETIDSKLREALDSTYVTPAQVEVSVDELKLLNAEAVELVAEAVKLNVERGATTAHYAKTDTLAEHYTVRLKHGSGVPYSIFKATGNDSLSPTPPRETLESYYRKTQATVIVNASGYRTGGWWVDQLIGLQIKNGVLIKGWDSEPGEDRGREALVVMKDGSIRLYDEAISPATILAEGGWNSWGWGAAAYKNGVVTNFASIPRYSVLSGRTLVGDTLDGDIMIFVFPGVSDVSGAVAADIAAVGNDYNMRNLYILDGGGSSQLMVEGKYLVRSSDGASRAVPDALYFYAPVNNPTVRDWQVITPMNATGTIRARMVDGVAVEIAVNVTGTAIEGANTGFIEGLTQIAAAGSVPLDMRPDANRRGSLSTSGNYEGSLLCASDGALYVIQRSGATRNSMSGSAFYTV